MVVTTLQTLDGAPLPWDLLKEMNEAWWEWQRHEEEPYVYQRHPLGLDERTELRQARDDGWTYRSLAARYGISNSTIADILKYRAQYAEIGL